VAELVAGHTATRGFEPRARASSLPPRSRWRGNTIPAGARGPRTPGPALPGTTVRLLAPAMITVYGEMGDGCFRFRRSSVDATR
jgi:hypothetical protein